MNKVIQGDCLEKLKELEDNSIDAIVTDPPYGLSFMGKKWDYDVPSTEIWKEALRVLKPGGYLLSFAGTRTQHRMAVRIEDAGFEIRDMIAWIYGSGFPKSLNIGKAVDKLQGNEKEVVGEKDINAIKALQNFKEQDERPIKTDFSNVEMTVTKGTSEWEGWGTALKPAHEPICMARKPLSEKTVAENCLKWGVGGINIDGCRVETSDKYSYPNGAGGNSFSVGENPDGKRTEPVENNNLGRFPANLIHDGSDEVVSLFPNTKSGGGDRNSKGKTELFTGFGDTGIERSFPSSEGSASRFFYCAKASKSERNKGCEELEEKDAQTDFRQGGLANDRKTGKYAKLRNNHPTVKPIALMEYLVKLVSKENAIVLDPFAGSGSTLIACKNLNRNYIGIEREEDYIEIINKRIKDLEIQHNLL
jgi:DNA modification methylase